jgi:hypothetical protein
MYGLVNKALEEMITGRFGPEKWEEIRQASGVSVEVFISNNAYPDEVTFNLVGAASRILGIPAEEILHDFGRHWVLRTAREGYGELLHAGGRDLPEFLRNLPTFHARISLIFPHLNPPRFRCFDETETSLRLGYSSKRAGLAPFVLGLLDGLGEMFDTPVWVTTETCADGEPMSHVFLVEWEKAAA